MCLRRHIKPKILKLNPISPVSCRRQRNIAQGASRHTFWSSLVLVLVLGCQSLVAMVIIEPRIPRRRDSPDRYLAMTSNRKAVIWEDPDAAKYAGAPKRPTRHSNMGFSGGFRWIMSGHEYYPAKMQGLVRQLLTEIIVIIAYQFHSY